MSVNKFKYVIGLFKCDDLNFVPRSLPYHLLYLCKIENKSEFGDSLSFLTNHLPILEIWPLNISKLFDKKQLKVLKNDKNIYYGPFHIPLNEFIHEIEIDEKYSSIIDKNWNISNLFNNNSNDDFFNLQTDLIELQQKILQRELTFQSISKSLGKVCIL